MKRIRTVSGVVAVIGILTGCAGMSETGQRTLSGSAIGAGAGGIIGAIAGNAGMGAAIGAGVGATSGFLYGKHKEATQEAYEQGVAAGKQSQSR